MKALLLILLGYFPLPAAAFGEKSDRIGPYYVYYEADNTLKPDEGKVRLECHFYGGVEQETLKADRLLYGIDGSNEQIALDEEYKAQIAVTPGEHTFRFAAGRNHEEIETIPIAVKPGELTVIVLNFFATEHEIRLKKPVIYCYPEKETEMMLNIDPSGEMAFTYPQLPEEGWRFTAQPDGTLSIGEKSYPYLFWEMDAPAGLLQSAPGYLVKRSEVTAFLEEHLSHMGFTDREKADFITYWGPLMPQHPLMEVEFRVNSECDAFAKLEIEPVPDHVNRVYILWRPVDMDQPYPAYIPQELPVLDRSGFDVLEWGGIQLGSEYN